MDHKFIIISGSLFRYHVDHFFVDNRRIAQIQEEMKTLDELPGVRETYGIIQGSIRTQKDRDLSDLMVIYQLITTAGSSNRHIYPIKGNGPGRQPRYLK